MLNLYGYLNTSNEKHIYQISYTTCEYFFFAFFLWKNISSRNFRKWIIGLSLLFLAFQIYYYMHSKLSRLDSIPIAIETILILFFIIYFFYEFSTRIRNHYIYNHYGFWLASGILIYLGVSFFFYISINELNQNEIAVFGNLTYLTELLKNIFFTVAIFVYTKYPESMFAEEKKKVIVPFLDMT